MFTLPESVYITAFAANVAGLSLKSIFCISLKPHTCVPEFVFQWNKSTISDRKWNRCPLVSKKRSGSCVLLSLSNSCWKKKMRQLCRLVRVIPRLRVGVTGSVRCRNFSITRPARKETMTDPRCRNSTLFSYFVDCSRLEKGTNRGIYPDRGTIPRSGYNKLNFFFTKSWKF